MIVNRRVALKQMLCISAGAVLIPSCMQDKSKSSILLKNLSISGEQEKMLAELSGTIIPATASPGAKEVYAHLFALKMLDDCFKKDDQQKFLSGMKQFEDDAKKKYSRSFASCGQKERESFLNELEKQKGSKEDIHYFYSTMKRLTIQGYTGSQYFLTKVQVYELIPGRYHGCVPVSTNLQKVS